MTYIPEYPVHGIRTIIEIVDQHAAEKLDGWLEKPVEHHVKHALDHLLAYLAEDDSEPHIEHALTRLAMAKHLHVRTAPSPSLRWRPELEAVLARRDKLEYNG